MKNYRDKFGIISGNPSIDAAIYACAADLPEAEAEKVLTRLADAAKKAKAAGEDFRRDRQCLDLYHELLVGAYLARDAHRVEYERLFHGKTPDWTSLANLEDVRCIVECRTIYEDEAARQTIDQARQAGRVAVYYPNNEKRIFDALDTKAGAYGKLVLQERTPYVISLFGAFTAGIYADEIEAIQKEQLSHRPEVSGVLFVEDDGQGGHAFTFIKNPVAENPIDLPSKRWNRRAA